MSTLQQFRGRPDLAAHSVQVAIGEGDLGLVKNETFSWGQLQKRLGNARLDQAHTLADYLALPRARQDALKSAAGFFVGGHCLDGVRKSEAIPFRTLVTLDIDAATDAQIDMLRIGLSAICDFEFFAHTTRKHATGAPRWRLILPAVDEIAVEKFVAVSRIVASQLLLDPRDSMDAVDDVSFRIAQIMYWPTVCRDAKFETIHNPGKLLDADAVLESFGDWTDWTRLPFSEKRSRKRPTTPGNKAEDPREKRGAIGAFCRAYDIPAAIEKFLPSVYRAGHKAGGKRRYTYAAGSTTNGAVVEDGGLFLYSHHGTDPCAEMLVNSFDLVRIHRFGQLDRGAEGETTSLPSYAAMIDFAESDDAVSAQIEAATIDYVALFDDHSAEDPGIAPRNMPVVARLNRKHALVMIDGKAVIVTERSDKEIVFGAERDLHAFYANDRVEIPPPPGSKAKAKSAPVSQLWMTSDERRTYENGVVFAPGSAAKVGVLNLWRGWATKPKPGASCARWLDHVREILAGGDEECFQYIVSWFAHAIQRPEDKPGVAIVLKGAKGAGKDIVADYFARILGRQHCPVISNPEHLTGRFNGHHTRALLLHVQEALWSGDRKAEQILKALVTSSDITIELKHVNAITMPSVLRLYLSTNADWAVPASEDERRWAVFNVSDHRCGDRPYFDALVAEMNGDGPAALLSFLQNYDLRGFDVRKPLATEGLRDQKIASLRDVPRWLFERLTEGEITGHFDGDWETGSIVIPKVSLRAEYASYAREMNYRASTLDAREFGKQIGAVLPGVKDRRQGPRDHRNWAYELPALPICRAEFEQWLGCAVPWATTT